MEVASFRQCLALAAAVVIVAACCAAGQACELPVALPADLQALDQSENDAEGYMFIASMCNRTSRTAGWPRCTPASFFVAHWHERRDCDEAYDVFARFINETDNVQIWLNSSVTRQQIRLQLKCCADSARARFRIGRPINVTPGVVIRAEVCAGDRGGWICARDPSGPNGPNGTNTGGNNDGGTDVAAVVIIFLLIATVICASVAWYLRRKVEGGPARSVPLYTDDGPLEVNADHA
jgi:hypothetical protein